MEKNKFKHLDEEEKDIAKSLENGEWASAEDIENLKEESKAAAESTLRKDKRMNIRISERDLKNLKAKALEEGVPYQTLVSMIIHKYISGKLKDTG